MIITLLLYWLAHPYADLAGERLRPGARLTARGLLATMLRELPILIGAAIPLATLLVCWIAGNRPVRRRPPGGVDLGRDRPGDRAGRRLRGRLKGRQLLSQAFVGAVARIVDYPPQGVLH